MSDLKDNWKNTGKGLGKAFKDLGSNILKTIEVGADKTEDFFEDKNETVKTNVTNDGSWRKTSKELGGAFKNLGKSIIKSARTGIDKLDEISDEKQD